MEPIDLHHGIWHSDMIDIGVLMPGLLIVGVHGPSQSQGDLERASKYVKDKFPTFEVIVVLGSLTYEALSGSDDLRQLIKKIVEESR